MVLGPDCNTREESFQLARAANFGAARSLIPGSQLWEADHWAAMACVTIKGHVARHVTIGGWSKPRQVA
jgi:hypothetical protein